MASLSVSINSSGQPVETVTLTQQEQQAMFGHDLTGSMILPDRPIGGYSNDAQWMTSISTDELLSMPPDTRMAAAGIPTPPALPQEVLDMLAPGVDPYASLQGPLAPVFSPAPSIMTPITTPSYQSPAPAGVPAATGAAGPTDNMGFTSQVVDPEMENWFTGSPTTPLSPALIGIEGDYPRQIYMESTGHHEIAAIQMGDPRIRRIPYGGSSGKGF